ncbi:efflux RND transporter periplasmic adaptor subunit [Phormidium tenue FACHB-886]|nr:efflux RND transporter periplasmic adaptor subunit [Phormidium tenue FACHB-886]
MKPPSRCSVQNIRHWSRLIVAPIAFAGVLLTLSSCSLLPEEEAQAQEQPGGQRQQAPAVETAIAETGSLEAAREYTGTTEPIREISLRAQAEGRLLDLSVDVGDQVEQGQVLGQLDDRILAIASSQAQAELAALQSEVAQAQAEVNNARTQVAQAEAEYRQAVVDAERLQSLAAQGVTTQQDAELAATAALTAEQAVRSAQEQVRTQQQAVVAAQGRVAAQRAAVAESQERRGYTSLTAPITGAVVERAVQPGDLVQPGGEVLKLGDFSAVKVVVPLSELELGGVRVGQPVQVKLDAFADRQLQGEVIRISPAADPTARLIPVEIQIPNNGRIGSGLLARVQFQSGAAPRIVVPETALQAGGKDNQSTIFLVQGEGEAAKAIARPVQIGERANGRVEIRSGLRQGEAFIVRSATPLKNNQSVRLSILSEQ